MSCLGKKPYVQVVLESLNSTQLGTLSTLINSSDSQTATFVSLNGIQGIISNTNKGVSYVLFELDHNANNVVYGYLCYTDTQCGLFAFQNGFAEMQSIKIDPTNKKFNIMQEHLTAEEFRRAIDDIEEAQPGGKDAWVEAMKTVVNTSNNNVHFSNTGFVEMDKMKINKITFQDTPEGETRSRVEIDNADLMIVDSTGSNPRKIYLNGVELGGGTKVYRHRLTSSGVSEIALINTSSTPLTTGSAVMTAATSALMINAQPTLYTPIIYWSVTGGAGGPVISYKYQNDSEIVSATWAALSATVTDTVYEI